VKRLLVIVPGLRGKTGQWNALLEKLKQEPEWASETKILPYDHGATPFTRTSASQLVTKLAMHIETEVITCGPFDDIVLMGHSMGALLVRQAYLVGLGSRISGDLAKPWASLVSRLVLFSGINRGVRLRLHEKVALTLLPRDCLLRDLLVGSDFVTNLRLWWIKKLVQEQKRPLVIQLKGSNDDLIEYDDSLDIEGFFEGYQLLVPGASHRDIMNLGNSTSVERYEVLRQAVLRPFDIAEATAIQPDASRKIYFVMHGIRANNDDWVQDLSAMISENIQGATVIPPTYGRFSALQFFTPFIRRRRVRWFQDLYSMQLSKNPSAEFHFVGHSYGTYLLGHGLSKLPSMTFGRVALCGSVLPSQWLWDNYRTQVGQVRNARARHDFPVGVLCRALRAVGMKDIGTAGYVGFHIPYDQNSEVFFYRGGHGASVSETARPDIVDFLINGSKPLARDRFATEDERFTRLSAASFMFAYLAVLFLLAAAGAFTRYFGPHTGVEFALSLSVLLFTLIGLLAFY
jgi:triacylglycerol esterase/lipase EstA (alpha/beta hydrolase family)